MQRACAPRDVARLSHEDIRVHSLFPVVCCDDVTACATFYRKLLPLGTVFETDWYAQLQSADDSNLQLGFVRYDHASVPKHFGTRAAGVFVTIEVNDVDSVHARAKEIGLDITYALRDEPWGQRHFMVTDPSGLLVDVVKLIPADPEFLAQHSSA